MRLSELSIRHPAATVVVAAGLVVLALPGLVRLELRTDGRALVPANAPEVVLDREVRQTFGVRDQIAVVLRGDHQGAALQPGVLRQVVQLTAALQGLEGVRPIDVVSLATELGLRHRPGTLRLASLLEPFPVSEEELAGLKEDLRRIDLYNGTLVSSDLSAAVILVAAPPERSRRRLIREIRQLVAATGPGGAERVDVLGAPVVESLLGSHILADLGVPLSILGDETGLDETGLGRGAMVPIALAMMALVFLVAFRRPAAVLLPLSEIGVCLVVLLGAMGWLGIPVYLTISVMPVILIAVGVADEIHVFRRYLDKRPADASRAWHREAVRATLEEMAPPIVRTSVTTAVAFCSFAASPIGPVRVFGLLTALGVLLCMLYSLTVIPALLVLGGPGAWAPRTGMLSWWRWPGRGRGLVRLARALARIAVRRHATVRGAAVLLGALALAGVVRLEVQDSWVGGLAESSGLARATRWFDSQLLGSHILHLALEIDAPSLEGEAPETALGTFELRVEAPTGIDPERLQDAWVRIVGSGERPREWRTWCAGARREAGRLVVTMPRQRGSARFFVQPQPGERLRYEIRAEPMTSPEVLGHVAALEQLVAGLPGVGGVLGPARYLETVGFMLRPNDPESRRLPSDPFTTRNRWSNYGRMRGEERLAQLVDSGRRRALVTAYLKQSSYVDTRRIMVAVREHERESLLPRGIRLVFAGDVAESQAMIGGIVSTQLRSLALSLVGILLVAAIWSRSLSRGLLCLTPPALAVLASLSVMGWTGVPLGVATSMLAGMTLGVGVDYAIHLLARYDRIRLDGAGEETAISDALAITGPAIIIDGCAVAIGLGVLVLSKVPANARLGGLLMASVLACLLVTLLVVPAHLAGRARGASGGLRKVRRGVPMAGSPWHQDEGRGE